MASPGVVAPALLLPVPLLALPLSLYNRSVSVKPPLLFFLAVFAAVAGATALCGDSLSFVARVFVSLLHATLSAVSIYALYPLFAYFLSLATLLIACELVSTLVPASPLLLPAALALVSRAILFVVAIVAAALLRRRRAAQADEEKEPPTDQSLQSSPTQATWPFPGFLAPPASPSVISPSVVHKMDDGSLLLLVLVAAQLFSTLSAGLDVAASFLVKGAISSTFPCVLVASSACTLLWSLTVLAIIQMLPDKLRPCPSEKQIATVYEQELLKGVSASTPAQRTRMPSLSRGGSLDFLSLRDPFASSPPPPPPLPPVGLGLDEVDVGWNGSNEIGMQYRFPAPRSVVKGTRRNGKATRGNGKKRLVHQNSSRTLLPVPETRGTETDMERDKAFGDEARLAQLLLQSLDEAEEDESRNVPTPVPTTTPPQSNHVQQSSRWSTGTTIQSIISGSVSNKSGASAYTTCASEKVPTSRISMNTIASALGSRKSSETKRKSVVTASSRG